MTNAQKFSDLYNQLDQAFAKSLGKSEHATFSQKISDLVHKNPVVRRYKDDLHQLGSLRNAIIHQSKNGVTIAEPNEETVELILQEFKTPSKVIPKFQFEIFDVTTKSGLI